jgi:hypothetical protein
LCCFTYVLGFGKVLVEEPFIVVVGGGGGGVPSIFWGL